MIYFEHKPRGQNSKNRRQEASALLECYAAYVGTLWDQHAVVKCQQQIPTYAA